MQLIALVCSFFVATATGSGASSALSAMTDDIIDEISKTLDVSVEEELEESSKEERELYGWGKPPTKRPTKRPTRRPTKRVSSYWSRHQSKFLFYRCCFLIFLHVNCYNPRSRRCTQRCLPRCIPRRIPRFRLNLFPCVDHQQRSHGRVGVSHQRSVPRSVLPAVQRNVLLQVHSARKTSMYVVVVLHARRRLGNKCAALSMGSVEPLRSIATAVAKVDVSLAHVIMSPSKLALKTVQSSCIVC